MSCNTISPLHAVCVCVCVCVCVFVIVGNFFLSAEFHSCRAVCASKVFIDFPNEYKFAATFENV